MNDGFEWSEHGSSLIEATGQTLYMVSATLVIGGLLGLTLGMGLYTTRRGGLLQNRWVFGVLNLVVNIFRPIPFLILLFAVAPLTVGIVGTRLGSTAMIVPMSVAATFGVSRIVEQNLVAIDPGVIEAARATGATRWRIITTLLVPEALGPLILGYTFICIAVVDMSALAGTLDGGGLGAFALDYGYKRWNFGVVWVTVIVIIILVQLAQALGNRLSRRAMHHN
ncbi:ABC transporter permease [Ornithinimicrobium faecis]|uniref:ABC transporter permease n=1 Tax=Ornithinimicrobium faecis TaxID=2934158 RepID=A0ABY4YP21_9MICO|nr:methionine ABC transporter permease [Ornithinimicrobium sp. HY1793]USQ78364.1 ABC transporter permease [Ornithinimicrobium sp. HY1793]